MGTLILGNIEQRAKGLAFDLYGTLIRLNLTEQKNSLRTTLQLFRQHRIRQDIQFNSFIRFKLLARDIQSYADFIREYDELLPGGDKDSYRLVKKVFESLINEFNSTVLIDYAENIIVYCKHLYPNLLLLSNSSSYHKKAVQKLGIERYFDKCIFSCDVGFAKPDPEIYDLLAKRSRLRMRDIVFVGDSYKVDYLAPRKQGANSIHVSKSTRANHRVTNIGLLPTHLFLDGNLDLSDIIEKIYGIKPKTIKILERNVTDPNKNNMLYLIDIGEKLIVAKFHGIKDASYIEYIGYKFLRCFDMFSEDHWYVTDGRISCLLLPYIESTNLEFSKNLAYQHSYDIGKYAAFSYVFGNIDFRPRNAIFTKEKMYLIDLEHMFFFKSNIYVSDGKVSNPFSTKMMSRAVNSFLREIINEVEVVEMFKSGFKKFSNVALQKEIEIRAIFGELLVAEQRITGKLGRHEVRIDEKTIVEVERRIGELASPKLLHEIFKEASKSYCLPASYPFEAP